jgi:L-lactate dehydrogenase complex protein LldE
LRELGVSAQPRKLLASVEGLKLVELPDSDVCCGFGGTFAVKYGELSGAIVSKKTERVASTGADVLLAGDLGCLMNMAGKLSREERNSGNGRPIEVRHVAEVLAGMTADPGIGASAPSSGSSSR